MFSLVFGLLESDDEQEWSEHIREINSGRLSERAEALALLHKLNHLVLAGIRKIESETFELASVLYKRKLKAGLKRASQTSKHRYCVSRPDGMHYYDNEGGKRLGIISLSSIEVCELSEGSGKTFIVKRNNGEIVEFTAPSTAAAKDWVAVLRPKVQSALLEGFLMKKKGKKGLSLAKLRYVVLTKDSLKYFEDKDGRCMGSFDLEDISAFHVREGDVAMMKIVLQDNSSYSFFAGDGSGVPLEWVSAVAKAKIALRGHKPNGRASGRATPERSLRDSASKAAPRAAASGMTRAGSVEREIAKSPRFSRSSTVVPSGAVALLARNSVKKLPIAAPKKIEHDDDDDVEHNQTFEEKDDTHSTTDILDEIDLIEKQMELLMESRTKLTMLPKYSSNKK